jgi:hypothetical protein
MFRNVYKLLFGLLMIVLFNSNITEAQTTTKTVYPLFSISPLGGIQFPIGSLSDGYKSSFNAGADFVMKVNKETAFFLEGVYYNMPGWAGFPDAGYIEITAGPRYTITSPNIKASGFLEAGLGAYIFSTKDYTPNGITIPGTSTTNFGVNVGPGVLLPLSKSLDFILKSKIHYVFQSGGSKTFITGLIGIDFKL